MIRISKYQKYESFVLYETILGIWVFYALISQFAAAWVILIQTIFFSYISAYYLLEERQRQIIHPFTSIIILYIFRIDQIILKTVFTEVLTEITSKILFLMLKYGDLIFLLLLFISMCISQSLRRYEMKSCFHFFTIGVIIVTYLLAFVSYFSPDKVILLDATTLQIGNLTRISIVDTCSGIYGLIIFLSSFIFFVNVTKSNRQFDRAQILLSGIVGLIGVYSLNLFRIIILIILSSYFPTNIWSEAHLYLGGIFIIGYLAIFWGIIWSKKPIQSPP
ncbi:MAG: exosortase/archaeosortase family protein [Candidatus Thorarchaeota archaeon]